MLERFGLWAVDEEVPVSFLVRPIWETNFSHLVLVWMFCVVPMNVWDHIIGVVDCQKMTKGSPVTIYATFTTMDGISRFRKFLKSSLTLRFTHDNIRYILSKWIIRKKGTWLEKTQDSGAGLRRQWKQVYKCFYGILCVLQLFIYLFTHHINIIYMYMTLIKRGFKTRALIRMTITDAHKICYTLT